MRLDEHLHQQFIQRLFPERDLLVPVLGAGTQFHAVQRALARQRLIQFFPSRQHAEDWICPQLFVIVNVFVAQRQTVDPLGEHFQNGVIDPRLVPPVQKHPASRGSRFRRLSVSRNRKAPLSELIVPPSNRATISREPHA